MDDDIISAFAFKTSKAIEKLIKDETNDLVNRTQALEAKILDWYQLSNKSREVAEHFGITHIRHG